VSDRDADKDDAVGRLRSALVSGQGVDDAMRWCWYQNPLFSSALLSESLREWFGAGCDIQVITRFIERVKHSHPAGMVSFPGREAEALIRASLGDHALLQEVSADGMNFPEIAISLLSRLFREWRPTSREVDLLFGQAQEISDALWATSPSLLDDERNWFEAGMHRSPFAYPLSGERAEIPSSTGEE
jgi:hypothetical protein